jgi:hypothetical protein
MMGFYGTDDDDDESENISLPSMETQGIFKNDSDKEKDQVDEEPLSLLLYAEVVKNEKEKKVAKRTTEWCKAHQKIEAHDHEDNKEKSKNVARRQVKQEDESEYNDKEDRKPVQGINSDDDRKRPTKRKAADEVDDKKNTEKINNKQKNEYENKKETSFEELYPEQEWPHEDCGGGGASEYGYDGFYIGMTYYYWDLLPYIENDQPPKRYESWSASDYYKKPIAGWREDSKKAQEGFYQLIKLRE